MFFVWKRNDGFIHASRDRMPDGWLTGGSTPAPGETYRPGSGIPVTFEELARCETWLETYDRIVAERGKQDDELYRKLYRMDKPSSEGTV